MLREEFGLAVENFDELVLVFDKSLPDTMLTRTFLPRPAGIVVKNSAPFDVVGIATKLTNSDNDFSIAEHEGIALLLAPPHEYPPLPGQTPEQSQRSTRQCTAFISDSVMLFGVESMVRKMISFRGGAATNTGLTSQLESLGNPLIALAVDARTV